MKVTCPNTRICAMCVHWNRAVEGKIVKPRSGMRNFMILRKRIFAMRIMLRKQHGTPATNGRRNFS